MRHYVPAITELCKNTFENIIRELLKFSLLHFCVVLLHYFFDIYLRMLRQRQLNRFLNYINIVISRLLEGICAPFLEIPAHSYQYGCEFFSV